MKYRYIAKNVREYNNTYYFTLSKGYKKGKQIVIRGKWKAFKGKSRAYNDKKAIEHYNIFYNENIQELSNYNITFKQVVDEFIKMYANNKLKPNTIKQYKHKIDKYLMTEYEQRQIRHIRSIELNDYINGLQISNDNKRKLVYILKSIFKYAVVQGYIKNNPCMYLYVTNDNEDINTNKISFIEMIEDINEDINALRKLFNKRRAVDRVVNIILCTGLRINELLCLTWNDIDLNKREITINKNLNYIDSKFFVSEPKTQKSKRKIYINDKLYKLLTDLKLKDDNEKNKLNLVLHTRTFNYLNACNVNKSFKKRLEKTKYFNLHLHSLRHIYTMYLIDNNVSITKVSNILGHCNTATTLNIYTKITKKDLKKACEIVYI